MGRWGDKIYESDSALDFFYLYVEMPLIRELNHLFSPEKVSQNSKWVTEVITVIEILLLFDTITEEPTLLSLDSDPTMVKRWRDTFFSVWDAKWDDSKNTDFPFHVCAYRKENRQTADQWFDRLGEIAAYFSSDDLESELSEFKPDEKLPYFSLAYFATDSGKTYPIAGFSLSLLLESLARSIVFILSDENRSDAIGFFEIEKVWVAVDVMAMLCESYSYSPSISCKTIDSWQAKMIDIWKARGGEDFLDDPEEKVLYDHVIAPFDKSKVRAKEYPPMFS